MTPRLLAFIILCTSLPLSAHHDVNKVIKLLSLEIAKSPTADLYGKRAIEYRAIRENEHAISDARAALKLNPKHRQALRILAQLLSDKNAHQEALAAGNKLLEISPTPHTHLLLANLHFAAGNSKQSLHHVRQAPLTDDHAHLLHSHLVQDPEEAIIILKKGHQRTKSIVLRNAWIDALLAAGQWQEALPLIEKEIETSRFRAAWLIRRARVHLFRSQKAAASHDLKLALAELAQRISPSRPDLTLIHDRGLALALMGRKEAARKDLTLLQESTFSPLSYLGLARLLE